ncbi:MAG TPA: hypothetical protein VFD70_00510 [Anaerolineae bacterium]|nr:hypothetical protein [Anaerolineae bacterium]
MESERQHPRVKEDEETGTYQHSDKPVEGDEKDIDQDLAERQGTERADEQHSDSTTETAQGETQKKSGR